MASDHWSNTKSSCKFRSSKMTIQSYQSYQHVTSFSSITAMLNTFHCQGPTPASMTPPIFHLPKTNNETERRNERLGPDDAVLHPHHQVLHPPPGRSSLVRHRSSRALRACSVTEASARRRSCSCARRAGRKAASRRISSPQTATGWRHSGKPLAEAGSGWGGALASVWGACGLDVFCLFWGECFLQGGGVRDVTMDGCFWEAQRISPFTARQQMGLTRSEIQTDPDGRVAMVLVIHLMKIL